MSLRSAFLGLVVIAFASSAGAQALFTQVTDPAIAANSPFSTGTSWVDVDGDSDLDLFQSNPSANLPPVLFLNNGDGTFTDTAGQLGGDLLDLNPASTGHSWADYDNDGDLDVCFAGRSVSSVLRNDGEGVMTRIGGGGGAFNGATVFGIGLDPNNRGWTCTWGDYDNDGFVDLLIVHPAAFVYPFDQPVPNTLYKNTGDGRFVEVTDTPITDELAPFTVGRWMDYDRDGDQDLFIGSGPANGTPAQDFLYKNLLVENGEVSFERITNGPFATERDGQVWNLIDYDNDGDLDAFVTNYSSAPKNELYRNDDGTFVKVTDAGALVTDEDASLANVWGDFDNDGDLDVFVSNEGGFPNRMYFNSGAPDYSFTDTGEFAAITSPTYGASAGDYDADGDLDLVVTPNFPGFPTLLYQAQAPEANHWMRIQLEGTSSNRSGLHAILEATVTLNGTEVTMTREVSAQSTFNGQNALDVHFGLGDATQIDELTIHWPSGTVDVFTDVAVDRFVVAEEGGVLVANSEGDSETPGRQDLQLEVAPNPTPDGTSVRYVLPESGAVRVTVYDTRGREVAVLVDGHQPAGPGEARFDGSGLASGVYLVRLEVGDHVVSRSFTLAR
ncbi:MAG: hypothetical protein Rubg2KO_10970 [Rubricoccaceae bacterium]